MKMIINHKLICQFVCTTLLLTSIKCTPLIEKTSVIETASSAPSTTDALQINLPVIDVNDNTDDTKNTDHATEAMKSVTESKDEKPVVEETMRADEQAEETSPKVKRKANKVSDDKDDDKDDDDGPAKDGDGDKSDGKADTDDDKKDDKDDDGDTSEDGDKKPKKKKVNKEDKSSSEADTDEEKDSNSDETLPDDKSDDTSEENSNSQSKSDPLTEEEGDSSSESRTSEERNDGKDTSEEKDEDESESEEEEESQSNTTENDQDESLVSSSESSNSDNDKNKLLIILLDGVNADNIARDEKKLKAFEAMRTNGVSVRYVKPVFPSNPMPNWYSIATGRYPDKHGIINDYMYDVKSRHIFMKDSSKEGKQAYWWNADAEPIWVTAKKQKKRVSVSWWAGCDIMIKRSKPHFCDPYEEGMSSDPKYIETVSQKMEDIMEKFEKDELDLAMVYYEAIGRSARRTGPDSKKTKKSLREFDKILQEIIDDISEKKLEDTVNVMVLSDNGIVTGGREIKLDKLIDLNDIDKIVGSGAFMMLKPEKSKSEFIFNQLRQSLVKGLNVYRSNKLPPRYKIKHASRLLPIIVTADEGFHLTVPSIKNKVIPSDSSEESNSQSNEVGFTGYDADHVEEARAILYALGPDFRVGYTGPPVKQVDQYNLFCKLLDIRPKDNDGTGKRIEKLLKGAEDNDSSDSDDDDSSDSSSDEDDDDGASIISLSTSLIILTLCRLLFIH